MPTRDDQVLLEDAVNVLGNPTDISLVGSRGFQAEASPTGLPSAPSGEVAAPAGTPVGAAADAVAGAGEAAAGGGGPGGPTALQKALTGLGLFQQTVGAANKLQNIPGREGNAFNVADAGLQDLGFSLSGAPGAGFIETPLGAMSQQDYAGLLNAFRSGTEGPAGLGMGGFNLTQPGTDWSSFFQGMAGPGEYAGAGEGFAEAAAPLADAAGAAGGVNWGGIAGGGALAALPIIMSALKAAGVEMPTGVSEAASTIGAVGGAALAPTALAGGVGLAAVPIMAAAMGELSHRLQPSEEWQSFPGRLSRSLTLENAAAQHFGEQLATPGAITNRQQLADLVGQYRATLGMGPETYESGTFSYNLGPEYQQYLAGLSDPFALPALPGATGTRHEGGQEVDFGPMQGALDQLMAAYQQYLPPGEAGAGNLTPWSLQELGLSRHPLFYNQFWNQQQEGGEGSPSSADAGVF